MIYMYVLYILYKYTYMHRYIHIVVTLHCCPPAAVSYTWYQYSSSGIFVNTSYTYDILYNGCNAQQQQHEMMPARFCYDAATNDVYSVQAVGSGGG